MAAVPVTVGVADTGAVAVSNRGGIVPARPCAHRVTTIMRDRGCADHNATDFACAFRYGIADLPFLSGYFGLSVPKVNGLVPNTV